MSGWAVAIGAVAMALIAWAVLQSRLGGVA